MKRFEVAVRYVVDMDENKESPELMGLFTQPSPEKYDNLIDAVLEGAHQREVKVEELFIPS